MTRKRIRTTAATLIGATAMALTLSLTPGGFSGIAQNFQPASATGQVTQVQADKFPRSPRMVEADKFPRSPRMVEADKFPRSPRNETA